MKKLLILATLFTCSLSSFAQVKPGLDANSYENVRMYNPLNPTPGTNTDSIHTTTSTFFYFNEARKGVVTISLSDTIYASFTGWAILQASTDGINYFNMTDFTNTSSTVFTTLADSIKLTAASGYQNYGWKFNSDYTSYRIFVASSGGSISILAHANWHLPWEYLPSYYPNANGHAR